ncbi:MAG TPA: LpqB family beta-propeller domain-containing protein, partial [Gemmatimonadaceae bacterium]|nr:LpqB family beta-propeller domain-containing protein [Gemmatimonadaceae bacterium]
MRLPLRSPLVSRAVLGGAVVLASLVPPVARAQEGGPLTLEALLAHPFPPEISAAPRGGAVAWVLNERGARNIWVAAPPAYQGRRLTSYVADDGQEISALTWEPDGTSLVFVRGGARNRAGESPNPAQDPRGAESAVHRVSLAGGAPVRLGAGFAPSISPDGRTLLISRGKLWRRSLTDAGGDVVEWLNIRGGMSNVRWSPDGTRIAYVSGRGDHAFVAVVEVATRAVTFLSPSVDTDGAPVWSPDSKRVAFVRQPASSALMLFKAERTGRPWSILVADVATGSARTVWTA